ncbi:MAG: serine/threonine-protein kinase [Micromonosporaceae bacterium]
MDTTQFPSLPELATALPGYRLIRTLAVTSMSMVYQAEEVELGRDVALKILHPNIAGEASFRERFEREVAVAASIAHPNVIPVHRKGEQDGVCFLVMQYVDGANLAQLIRDRGRLGLPETVRIVRQVAEALGAAHEKGLVHRDVKPGNVLIDRRAEHVYLCDFGIAKQISTGDLTATGQFLGTSGYAAPEQIHGGEVDHRADQYALGCLIYECLTGERPFPRGDGASVLWSHMNETPRRVTDRAPELPSQVADVIAKTLQKRPADRYPSCAAMAADLALAASQAPSAPASQASSAPASPMSSAPASPAPSAALVPAVAEPQTVSVASPSPELAPAAAWLAPAFVGQQYPVLAGQQPVVGWRQARRTPALVISTVIAVALLAAVTLVAWSPWRGDPSAELLERVPAQLRGQCESTEAAIPGADQNLLCRADTGQSAVFGFFGAAAAATASYQSTVRESDVDAGSGDCATTTRGEHQFPGVGGSRGRVLCEARGQATVLTWHDTAARTVARAESADGAGGDLVESWRSWVGVPGFATDSEQGLIDAVYEHQCQRAPASSLDDFLGAEAGIECNPEVAGVRELFAYQFGDADQLRRAYRTHADEVDAPSGVWCGDDPEFLGTDGYNTFDLDMGSLLCYQGDQGEWVLEWTIDPLLVHVKATGDDREKLLDWWADAPPRDTYAESINSHSDPQFPTDDEAALLEHVPAPSRVNCMRVTRPRVAELVDGYPVTAVMCGPTQGAEFVYYFQFADREDMRADYGGAPDSGSDECGTKASTFEGDHSYQREGDFTGWLRCDLRDDGSRYLVWTDDRLKISVFANEAAAPAEALDWWETEAGPI